MRTVHCVRIRTFLPFVMAIAIAGCSSLPSERQRTVTVKPKWEHMKLGFGMYWHRWILPTVRNGDHERIDWPCDAPSPPTLSLGKTYALDLIDSPVRMVSPVLEPNRSERPLRSSELQRVRYGRFILYDASICRVHHVPMRRVEVKSGLLLCCAMPDANSPYSNALERFPNCAYFASRLGDSFYQHYVWQCRICAEGYQSWLKEDAAEEQSRYEENLRLRALKGRYLSGRS